MSIQVFSEIGRLRRVLLHKPGPEIDLMVPAMMERLLFDDILFSNEARQEHDAFRRVLEAAEIETFEPVELLADVLADDEVKSRTLERLGRQADRIDRIDDDLLRELDLLAPADLAETLIGGIPASDQHPGDRLRSFYRLAPVPNYCFQRDPQVVLGDRVMLSSMATEARQREPLLARTIFENHPKLAGYTEVFDLVSLHPGHALHTPHLEGGDVLIPSPEVLMVGLSERTNRRGVEAMVRHLRGHDTTFRHVIVVELPRKRSYMHLDTVFTFIDHGLCLAYMPVIAPSGAEAGHVYRIDLREEELSYRVCDDLPAVLRAVGLESELVPCGGTESLIGQQREQWTDGANAFALAPGVITLYRRNHRTTRELEKHGFRIVDADDVISGRENVINGERTVITLDDHELSRARGGPRCMTMPLERDPLQRA